jgi:integrase
MIKKSTKNIIQFTTTILESLPIPSAGRVTYTDAQDGLLKLYVTSNGTKTFFVRKLIKGRDKKVIIGSLKYFTVERARQEASIICGLVAKGVDPLAEKEKEKHDNITFGQHFQDYLERYSKVHKKSWRYDEEEVNRHLSHWFNRRLSDITKSDVQKIHEKIGLENGFYQANTIVRRISSIFNKAIEWEWVGRNPAIGIKKFKERSRERFIQPSEMPLFLKAVDEETNPTFRDFYKVLLLTGVRKSNGLAMRWDQINWERHEWNIPMTKNGESLIIPLLKPVIEILKNRKSIYNGPWVFPQEHDYKKHITTPAKSWGNILARATFYAWKEDKEVNLWLIKMKNKFRSYVSPTLRLKRILALAAKEEIELPSTIRDIRIHDLRRTFGSYQALNGASLPIIGRSLGHKSPQSTAIYARLNLDPVRASMEKAGQAIFGG